MNKIIEKIKDIGKPMLVTKELANMLALTGKICTIEDRTQEFLKEVNEIIFNKARLSQFRYMIELPAELNSQESIIQEDLISRGFSIHKLTPEIKGVFIIDWK